jgi:hypothetical protein
MAPASSPVNGRDAHTLSRLYNQILAREVTLPRWLLQHLHSSTQRPKLAVKSGGGGGKRRMQIVSVVLGSEVIVLVNSVSVGIA